MEEGLYRDDDLSVSETRCKQCESYMVIYSIPIKSYQEYIHNPNQMIEDLNKDIDIFYCPLCGCQYVSISKVIKINVLRKESNGHRRSDSTLFEGKKL